MSNIEPVLSCVDLCKSYSQGPSVVQVLKSVAFQLRPGERVAIVGSSGSGKSTLLNLLGGLDTPTQGSVMLAGKPLSELSDNARGRLRNQHLGFVYQFHHLLPEFSARENVEIPMRIAKMPATTYRARAETLLAQVGLAHRLDHKPSELSGGERQRVAIARALAMQPACVLMDEPTGNLDAENAEAIQALMLSLSQEHGLAFVVVTHDMALAERMDQVLLLEKGSLRAHP
ncbi:ATP-binding cassette domain-containing protein [Simiduia sp. 21SJ11W-1]|uniref:ABC transporter ATP-binding protein n=1 Tax=Simiduia sp. 21SJ11W-1 TaxID=2909669 RepID=UPI00209FB68A|nr:ATP-binding cassette domain-containing protein [Simiduia sp. 21SJ11W-1]UTA49409.1 ATP-binding cassette domain-containing protein [Simiduia sp. 21SJ11W-1]